MGRDWRWRKASFDGATFYVDNVEIPGARRVVTHEYPGGEQHDNEDLGKSAAHFTLNAYFASETADVDSAALRARLAQEGPGLLQVPMFGALNARARNWQPAWTQQKLNYVGFQIQFVEETATDTLQPVGYAAAMLAQAGSGLAVAAAQAIALALTGADPTSFVVSDIAGQIGATADRIDFLRANMSLSARVSNAAQTAVADARNALALAPSTDLPAIAQSLFAQVDSITSAAAVDPSGPLGTVAQESFADYQAALAQWGVSPLVSIAPLAASLVFAAQQARALALVDYTDRAAAAQARQNIAALAATYLPVYGALGPDAVDAFDDFYGQAAALVSRQVLDLAPSVHIRIGASLPANVLAWRLYGDPTRSQELIDRNRVATPCFMPLDFEAASA